MTDSIRIVEAGESDLPGLLAVQHEAFARVADEVGIPSAEMPPVRETLEALKDLAAQGWRFWVARDDAESPGGAIVGTVRGLERDGTVEIGRLAVATSHMRRGIGVALMRALEAGYPRAHTFSLFTGHNARVPLALYDKLGYTYVGDEILPNGYRLVWLEKRVEA